MKTVLSLMLAALLVSTGVAAQQAQQQKPAPASGLEKALIGTWNGSWTGGSSGTVTFTFVRGTDGKLGGSAAPQPNDGQGYTTTFTSVVVADDKVTMKMLTPDGGAEITVQALVVRTIRPDTVFVPYHWAGERSVNLLTHRTLDPRSKIPEFKVSACRVARAAGPPAWAATAVALPGEPR